MAVFDHALMFMSTGNLTKTGYSTNALKIRGTPIGGLAARIVVPRSPGVTGKILPSLYVSDDNSTFRLAATYPGGAQSWLYSAGGKEFILPVETDKKYVKLYFTITGGTTGTSFGAVKAGLVEGVGRDWTRAVNFSQA